MTDKRAKKPLGGPCYGSIGHLPGSRRGSGDHGVNEGQGRICCSKARDKFDTVIVTEKLDGSNVGVARIEGVLVPLIRAGYPAQASHWKQHRLFAFWVASRLDQFDFLNEGERLCGEWLAQAHGTKYDLKGRDPFVAFDLFRGKQKRVSHSELQKRCREYEIATAPVIHEGKPISTEEAMKLLGTFGRYGATEPAEGCVWRVERKGKFDFLAKFVRHDKVDGKYFVERDGKEPDKEVVWNWEPDGNQKS